MAGRKPYSPAYKAKLVERMQGPKGISACRLAKETGISQQTLSRWRLEVDNLPFMAKKQQSGRHKWTVEERVYVLSEATYRFHPRNIAAIRALRRGRFTRGGLRPTTNCAQRIREIDRCYAL